MKARCSAGSSCRISSVGRFWFQPFSTKSAVFQSPSDTRTDTSTTSQYLITGFPALTAAGTSPVTQAHGVRRGDLRVFRSPELLTHNRGQIMADPKYAAFTRRGSGGGGKDPPSRMGEGTGGLG